MRYLCFLSFRLSLSGLSVVLVGVANQLFPHPLHLIRQLASLLHHLSSMSRRKKPESGCQSHRDRLEIALKQDKKNIEWVYDQSLSLNPVASKLQELGLTLEDIYADPALAAKLGKHLMLT